MNLLVRLWSTTPLDRWSPHAGWYRGLPRPDPNRMPRKATEDHTLHPTPATLAAPKGAWNAIDKET